jgi:alpha-1,2-glucosyltransferase
MEVAIAAVVTAAAASLVAVHVPAPYMDETLHIPQAQRTCNGSAQWDDRITTFPGLYLASAAAQKAVAGLIGSPPGSPCSVPFLRAVNAGLGVLTAVAISLAVRRLHPYRAAHGATPSASAVTAAGQPRKAAASSAGLPPTALIQPVHALAVALLPTHVMCTVLYYTDAGALLWVIASYLLIAAPPPPLGAHQHRRGMLHACAAAAASALAILFRQTNAVWVAFAVAVHVVRAALAGEPPGAARSGSHASTWRTALPRAVAAMASAARDMGPVLSVLAGFAAFVAWNGGIVVGDKAHHLPVRHYAQLGYLCGIVGLYAAVSLALVRASPHIAAQPVARRWMHLLGWLVGQRATLPPTMALGAEVPHGAAGGVGARGTTAQAHSWVLWRPAVLVALAGAMAAGVHYGTYAHPFLLADNRHYTFYLWSRVLAPHPLLRLALAPCYVAGAALAMSQLAASADDLRHGAAWAVLWLAASAAVVIPAHLLEPRYFTVPIVLYLLHARPPTLALPAAILAGHAAVLAVTLYVFLYRPFVWPGGEVARFMW